MRSTDELPRRESPPPAGRGADVEAVPVSQAGWRVLLALLLSLIGLAVSGYLTAAHYAGVPLACPDNGVIDCATVTSSAYAVVGDTALPVSGLGLGWFLLMGAGSAWLMAHPWRRGIVWAQLGLAAAGLLYVLYLVFVELVRLHRVCQWCTVAHVAVLAIFALILSHVQEWSDGGES